MIALAALVLPGAVSAQVQSGLVVGFDRALRFGQFALLGSGSRSLADDGAVTDLGLLSVGREGAQTARFTIQYQRRPASGGNGPIIVQVVLSAPSRLVLHGLKGRITMFDVSDHGPVRPGEPFEVTLSNCTASRCAQSFDVGATLEIEGEGDGSTLAIPLSLSVRTVSEQ